MKTKKRQGKQKAVKLQAIPLTEQQIQEFVKYYNKHKSFPGSKIPCSVTGKLTTCIGPWMVKKIKQYGSAEGLLRNYKCRGALKNEREATKVVKKKRKQKTQILKDEQKNWVIPKMTFVPPRPLTNSEITQTTETQCLRPDIFLSNDRHCDGCSLYNLCSNSLKNMPKYSNTITKKQTTKPKGPKRKK